MNQQLEQAMKTVADLVAKRDQIETRKLALEAVRESTAFDALTGDKKAKAKLVEATEELLRHDAELANFDAAIRTAEQKVLEAEGVERAAIDREKGEQALLLANDMMQAAAAADMSLKHAFMALSDIRDAVLSANRLGCTAPSVSLVDSNLKRALISASMNASSPSLILGQLPQAERQDLTSLCGRWQVFIEGWAQQKIGDQKPKEEAA